MKESNRIYITTLFQQGSILLTFAEKNLFLKNLPIESNQKGLLIEVFDMRENKVYERILRIRDIRNAIPLPINEVGVYFLRIYVQENIYGVYTGMLFKSDVPFYLSPNGRFRFIETVVAEPNREFLSKLPEPRTIACFQERIRIRKLSESITCQSSGTYDKILAIHDWLAENLHYDYDALENMDDKTICITKPVDVISSKRTICQGYTDLAVSLMRSIGIPSLGIVCYALGIGSSGGWERKENLDAEPNHIFPAAYCDSRWIYMDVTWDSKNEYRKGQYLTSGERPSRKYFDMTTRFLSNTHRLISIQNY